MDHNSLRNTFGQVSPIEHVNLVAQLADTKESIYKATLGLAALIECLLDRGILTREEIAEKAKDLEMELSIEPFDHL